MSSPDAPLVTVFVQAYRTEAFVGECLESVLAQRGGVPFELLVIDDASPDGTAGEIAKFRDARMRVVRHERNAGAIATANEGYQAARGAFILRLDSDDRLRPDCLRLALDAIQADARRGLVYGDIAAIDEAGRVVSGEGMIERHGRPADADEWLALLLENFIPAPTTLVRREALQPLLPVPAQFRFLDWYVTTGVLETWSSCFVGEVLADYRVHPGNMHRAMILDRGGERTSLDVLDRLFESPARAEEKRRWRRRVYAQHHLTYADKYFGLGMTGDARRCYWRALVGRPSFAFTTGAVRRLAGSLVGRRLYDGAKAVARAERAL